MSLSNYNINQQLEHYIDQFLDSSPPPSFPQLKTLIIARQPIAPVHNQIVSELTLLKSRDQEDSVSLLKRKAYEQQTIEDEAQRKNDEQMQLSDQIESHILTDNLRAARLRETQLEFRLMCTPRTIITRGSNVHQHAHQSSTSGSTHVHTHSGSRLNAYAHVNPERLRLEIELDCCKQNIIQIQSALSALRIKNKSRQERSASRNARKSGLLANSEDLLSSENFNQLMLDIQNIHHALETQCASLIREANGTNYFVFLHKLELLFSKGTMPPNEIDALRNTVRLMNQCAQYDTEVQELQSELNAAIRTIANNQAEKERQTTRLNTLFQKNPELRSNNQRLDDENAALELTRAENRQKRDKLITPSLILLASSLVASTPIILTLTGVIPAVLTPALLFTLVSFPAALLAVTTLVVGIIAITYAIRSRINTSNIESNQRTINGNIIKMEENRNSIAHLEDTLIPELNIQIHNSECIQSELTATLERTCELRAQLLIQANNLEPIRLSQSSDQIFAQIPSAPPESEVLDDSLLPPLYSEADAASGAPA